MSVNKDSTFTDPGATVSDNIDTGLSASVSGSVDTSTVGSYTLTYNATDNAGNSATPVIRTVNVVEPASGGGAPGIPLLASLAAMLAWRKSRRA
jgi:hypothetical protein